MSSRGRSWLPPPDKLVQAYRTALLARGLSRATLVSYLRGVRYFLEFLARRRRPLECVSPLDVDAFLVWASQRVIKVAPRKGQRVNLRTVDTWIAGLASFCAWLVKNEHRLLDPAAGLDRPRFVTPLPRVLTRRQVEKLIGQPSGEDPIDQRDRAILEVLYSSGLRVSELSGLDLTDVDLANLEILVRHGKGGKMRRVPLGPPAARAVTTYLERGREHLIPPRASAVPVAVFLSRAGTRLCPDLVERMVTKRAARARIAGPVTPHTFRHSAAVHLLRGGADIRHVQEFLGHAGPGTTAHYTRLTIDDLKAMLARVHPRRRLGV